MRFENAFNCILKCIFNSTGGSGLRARVQLDNCYRFSSEWKGNFFNGKAEWKSKNQQIKIFINTVNPWGLSPVQVPKNLVYGHGYNSIFSRFKLIFSPGPGSRWQIFSRNTYFQLDKWTRVQRSIFCIFS